MNPSYPELRETLLGMAEARDASSLLHRIARELSQHEDVALVRIWIVAPGDACSTCPMRDECPHNIPCLHLAASAGSPLSAEADWSRIDGDFRRFPIGVRKIGHIAEGEALCVEDIELDESWIARPDWTREEGIRGFGGAPLTFQGEVLGVLGVFTRSTFCPDTVAWLRIISDHAASALATSRAFEEVDRLRAKLAIENEYLREEVDSLKAPSGIVGRSAAIQAVLERISLVAPTNASVLIQGASGTGKELVAREIHRQSGRSDRPLIQVNCAAIPSELYESEFFGHVRGAFTGASQDRAGRFAAANGGTLFLDEVGEIPLGLQGKLLRVLQEGTYERVGEEHAREVDVRLVAATNRDLREEVAAGRFREDLYYRLDVFPIAVAPLCERRDDIVPLAEHFLADSARQLGIRTPALSASEGRRLTKYDWPGNVRELQNVIERALITWRGGPLEFEIGRRGRGKSGGKPGDAYSGEVLSDRQVRDLERENIRRALVASRWKVAGPGGAAERLEIKSTTLASRIRKLGIERPVE